MIIKIKVLESRSLFYIEHTGIIRGQLICFIGHVTDFGFI